jgi:hypothetical protein
MTDAPALDEFWLDYFAPSLESGQSVEKTLGSTVGLRLERDDVEVDLALCAHMPRLREIWFDVPGTRFLHTEAIAQVPTLREVRVRTNGFSQADLELVTAGSSVSKLYLTGAPRVESLEFLNARPSIKLLSLDGVTGVTPADIARLQHITTLEIDRSADSDFGALAAMPRLRRLEIDGRAGASLDNLDFLAAPKLLRFETSLRAKDDSGLEAVRTKTQLQQLDYPLRDVSALVECRKVTSLTLDGSVEHDLSVISHLPIAGVRVLFAPSQAAVDAIREQVKAVWSVMSFGYRADWEDDPPAPEPPRAPDESAPRAPATPAAQPAPTPEHVSDEEPAPRRGFWKRLLGR